MEIACRMVGVDSLNITCSTLGGERVGITMCSGGTSVVVLVCEGSDICGKFQRWSCAI